MSPDSPARGRLSGRTVMTAVLVIIAVLAITAGILYFAEPAKSLPGILGTITHPPRRANADRPLRGAVALVAGAVCLVAAWLVSRHCKSSAR